MTKSRCALPRGGGALSSCHPVIRTREEVHAPHSGRPSLPWRPHSPGPRNRGTGRDGVLFYSPAPERPAANPYLRRPAMLHTAKWYGLAVLAVTAFGLTVPPAQGYR